MPVNQHLTWVEVKDFSPGLWTNTDWLMPPNGWQVMEDAYPQVGGGIRAFHKATSVTTSGIVSPTKERLIGLYSRGSVPARSGAPTDLTDRYLCTYFFDSGASAGSKARPRFYRMDGTNSETTWTQIFKTSGSTEWGFATSDNNAPQWTSFVFFQQLSGSPNDQYVIAVVRYVNSTDAGIYRFNYNDLSSAQKGIQIKMLNGTLVTIGMVTVHQSRLMVSGGTTGGTLYFSNAGDAASSASTSFVQLDPSVALPQIVGLNPSPPSDLFVFRQGAAPIIVQGDITNQTSQVMGEGINGIVGQDVIRMPDQGYALIGANGYVYFTDGVTYTNISQQLKAFGQVADAVAIGSLSFLNEFLFAPGGLVYHLPTKSWFSQTQMAGSFHNVERFSGYIWGPVGTGTSFTLAQLTPKSSASASRVSTYHIKTAPLASVDGRRIGMREVQMYVKSYDANAQITVTVNGVANTVTCPSTGRQMLSFLFQQRDEVLDVDIVSTAGNAANEAPSIERLRLGFEPGTNLAPSE